MGVKVSFECGGCFETVDGTAPIQATFLSFSGRSFGLGTWETGKVTDVVPDGWIAFDPYTACTYCPDCWKSIVAEPPDAAEGES